MSQRIDWLGSRVRISVLVTLLIPSIAVGFHTLDLGPDNRTAKYM